MVPIVRKEDSSNHSHDHTHDRYHLGRQCRNDYPDHSLPQVSASEHTHDHSHAVRIAVWVGSTSSAFKPLERRDHDATRPCSVDDATGLSAMLMARVRVGVDDRLAIKARSGVHRGATYATRVLPRAAGWAGAGFEPLAGCDRADLFDHSTTESNSGARLRKPTWLKPVSNRSRLSVGEVQHVGGEWRRDRRGALHISLPGGVRGYVSFRNSGSRSQAAAGQSLYRSRFAARRRSARLSPWG